MNEEHGELPSMNLAYRTYGSSSTITITNDTDFDLTLLYSGIESKRLVLSPHNTSSVSLLNGRYRIAASVSDTSVRDYAGTEDLDGASYAVTYYISTNGLPRLPRDLFR